MGRTLRRLGLMVVVAGGLAAAGWWRPAPASLVLTGIVTTDDVLVSAQVGGRLVRLAGAPGTTVARGQVLAEISPEELQAESRYYASMTQGAGAQLAESEAAMRYQQQQAAAAVDQATATLAASEAGQGSVGADLEQARLTFGRVRSLAAQGAVAPEQLDQARTRLAALEAQVTVASRQVEAARATLRLAQANAEQVSLRRSQVAQSRHQLAAAGFQRERADARLAYAAVKAPIDGVVDVRVAREGEIVAAGQTIVSIVNPDDFWVRVDVEESYVDRVRVGDHLRIELASGATLDGVVFERAVDGGFATQRDVSRTKRDVRTFALKLRVDNRDRRLALGMTARVHLPLR